MRSKQSLDDSVVTHRVVGVADHPNVFLFGIYSVRLSVRTSGFHPGKRGSTPLPSTMGKKHQW